MSAKNRDTVSDACGVIYASSCSRQMYALDTISGNILCNFASRDSVTVDPSLVDGLYGGSDYRNIPPSIGNNKVYAFSLVGGAKLKGK
jgi:outer membrane protein assembly factor BamB